MSTIVLFSDSSCDIPEHFMQKYDVKLIPYYVSFDAETYVKEIEELSISDFYAKMRESRIFPKTSLPSINDYIEAFTPYLKQDLPIICVCLSSHFSGSYNAAVNARTILLEHYPNAQIAIINSLNATGGQYLLVEQVAHMIADDLDFNTVVEIAKRLRETARIFFYVDTLDYLEKGGRIGKAAALLGTVLNVKPVLFLEDGQLFPCNKMRGKKRAIQKIVELTNDYTVLDGLDDYSFALCHGDCPKDSQLLAAAFESIMGVAPPEPFNIIGVTIGVNTGPDAQGIACIKKYDRL
ncbi:MAG TPA: DegV family protein [Epulopiscium sp.]|nr:DegV family protein [Candidatus Epulonipiscium sp.]